MLFFRADESGGNPQMDTETIPVIELNQTDPKQRGQAYGEAARQRIENILAVYREIFHRITGETWQETVVRGAPFILKAKISVTSNLCGILTCRPIFAAAEPKRACAS